MNKKRWIYSGFSPPDLHEEGETVLFSVSCQSQEKSNQVSGNPNGHWCITAIFALTGVCMLLSHRRLPALLQFNNTFGYNDFFSHLFKNTPHITPIMPIMIRAGKENGVWLAKRKWGEKNKHLKRVISGGSWNNWCWARALVPCGVVIEPRWLRHKDGRAGRKVGRQPAMIMFVGRWMFTHWPLTWRPCAHSEMQAHLPVTLEEGKKMGGSEEEEEEKEGVGEKNKAALIGLWPTIPIEISHSQAGCSPEAGGFALETAPVAIFGMWPDGGTPEGVTGGQRWFRIHPSLPLQSTLTPFLRPSLPPALPLLLWRLHKPRPLWPTLEIRHQQNHVKRSRKGVSHSKVFPWLTPN